MTRLFLAKLNKGSSKCQGNVVLGNAQHSFVHSFGRAQDRTVPPTQKGDPPTQGEHSGSNSKGSSDVVPPAATNINDSGKSDLSKESKKICRFYTQNKCKFGRDCRFDHPKFCLNFKKFGMKKFNPKGCEDSCTNYHPKGCFESMRSKTCKREDCNFFHTTGTKKVDSSNTPNSNRFLPLQANQNTSAGVINDQVNSSEDKGVFPIAKAPWELAIENSKIMFAYRC